jgi:hypothetical protein
MKWWRTASPVSGVEALVHTGPGPHMPILCDLAVMDVRRPLLPPCPVSIAVVLSKYHNLSVEMTDVVDIL